MIINVYYRHYAYMQVYCKLYLILCSVQWALNKSLQFNNAFKDIVM